MTYTPTRLGGYENFFFSRPCLWTGRALVIVNIGHRACQAPPRHRKTAVATPGLEGRQIPKANKPQYASHGGIIGVEPFFSHHTSSTSARTQDSSLTVQPSTSSPVDSTYGSVLFFHLASLRSRYIRYGPLAFLTSDSPSSQTSHATSSHTLNCSIKFGLGHTSCLFPVTY